MAHWMNVPIDQIPRDEAATQLQPFQTALAEVELGAARARCDWEFDLRKEGIDLLLPEIQEMRRWPGSSGCARGWPSSTARPTRRCIGLRPAWSWGGTSRKGQH